MMQATFSIDLGARVKDKVSGFTGIVTSRYDCLTGCNRYAVQGQCGADGKMPEAIWFDEHILEVLDPAALDVRPAAQRTTGAYGSDPSPR